MSLYLGRFAASVPEVAPTRVLDYPSIYMALFLPAHSISKQLSLRLPSINTSSVLSGKKISIDPIVTLSF